MKLKHAALNFDDMKLENKIREQEGTNHHATNYATYFATAYIILVLIYLYIFYNTVYNNSV
jgi:hypothetical protein